jgi:DNA-binding response OmpR family regulator
MIVDIYLTLPDLDGYTLASRIRELPATAHTPIIFITGMDAPVHRTLSHGLGAIYLTKPFTVAELLRAMAQALPRSERGTRPAPQGRPPPGQPQRGAVSLPVSLLISRTREAP